MMVELRHLVSFDYDIACLGAIYGHKNYGKRRGADIAAPPAQRQRVGDQP